MIVNIYRERGKNKKSRGERRRGVTLIRIILRGARPKKGKNFRGARLKTGKIVRIGQDLVSPLFCPSWDAHYKVDTKQCHSNSCLSIYGM
jgi:hypothetical protein